MTDYQGFPKSMLIDIFNGMISELKSEPTVVFPELPEPMFGEMGCISQDGEVSK